MDRYHCPACGAQPYSGGRCRTCGYKPFVEEIAHGNHYHQGEPLERKTRPRPAPPAENAGSDCADYTGARSPRIPKPVWVGLAVVGALVLSAVVPGGYILLLLAGFIFKDKLAVTLFKDKQ